MKRALLIFALSVPVLAGTFLWLNVRVTTEPLPPVSPLPTSAFSDSTRPWWHGTVVYQIYPRSYQDTDGDGIGDLEGIIQRLDYLADLGVETLWLSPFFESPQDDFGYDVSDFERVDPVYGDSLVVARLIEGVHRRGLKIVFDLVLNHTSDQHRWFVESRSSRSNPRADWYVWRDGDGEDPPNNWHNALGQPAWHYDEVRDQWYYSAFLPFQPDLNYRDSNVRSRMLNVARFWLDRGVDGFRLDIFNFLYEADTLADHPWSPRFLPDHTFESMMFQKRKYTLNQPETFEFAKTLRSVLDEYDPPRFTVGEVFGPHSVLRRLMGDKQNGLHTVFLFSISDFQFNADFFREQIRAFEAFYPHPIVPSYVFSNHDRPRAITRLGNDIRKAKLLAMLQLTVRGIPYIYQGEEVGMHTASMPPEGALDPLAWEYAPISPKWASRFGIELNRDNVRTPMQWNDGPNAGFTDASARPWLQVQHNYRDINVEAALTDSLSLLNTYRLLLRYRQSTEALRLGSLQLIGQDRLPEDILAYRRTYGNQSVVVYLNLSAEPTDIKLSGQRLFTIGSVGDASDASILGPYSGVVLVET